MPTSSSRPRVLYVSNSHPDLLIGGAEVYSYDLFRAVRDEGSFEPVLLARTVSRGHAHRQQTPFRALDDQSDQVLWFVGDHDYFWLTTPDKRHFTIHLRRLLESYRPDVVHIQHTVGLGVDMIRQIRKSLPDAPIVYTLHEFLPLCHSKGLLLRHGTNELCWGPTPQRCHECFPDIPPERFFLRDHFIRSHLRHVDLFLAPSEFLLERYRDWGVEADRIQFLEYGRRPLSVPEQKPPTTNFGFFGQIRPHKGLSVVLRAMRLLQERGSSAHLFVSGAHLRAEVEPFQAEVDRLLAETGSSTTYLGPYSPSDLASRMASVAWVVIPSIWWENSPLVIQEAFMAGRPVLCSGIGGMAEKVSDGVNGLYFRVGDEHDLAEKMAAVCGDDAAWARLRQGIPTVPSVSEAVAAHEDIYRRLMKEKGARAERLV